MKQSWKCSLALCSDHGFVKMKTKWTRLHGHGPTGKLVHGGSISPRRQQDEKRINLFLTQSTPVPNASLHGDMVFSHAVNAGTKCITAWSTATVWPSVPNLLRPRSLLSALRTYQWRYGGIWFFKLINGNMILQTCFTHDPAASCWKIEGLSFHQWVEHGGIWFFKLLDHHYGGGSINLWTRDQIDQTLAAKRHKEL